MEMSAISLHAGGIRRGDCAWASTEEGPGAGRSALQAGIPGRQIRDARGGAIEACHLLWVTSS
jgi:hypothetical protein